MSVAARILGISFKEEWDRTLIGHFQAIAAVDLRQSMLCR